jgi:membrane fusion protein
VLARSVPIWCLSAGAAAFATLILALLYFGEYTKRTPAVGLLVPSAGAIRIVPPTAGSVLDVRVGEGHLVHKGDVLFVVGDDRNAALNDSSANLGVTVSRNILRQRAELERSRENERLTAAQVRDGLASRIDNLTVELGQTEREITLNRSLVNTARATLERFRSLARSNFVSAVALQEKESLLLDAQARLVGVERSRTALQKEITSARNEIEVASSRETTRMAEIERAVAETEQALAENSAKYRYEITAPADGTVTAILTSRGQVVGGQPMATLLTEGSRLEAQLFIPSKAVGFVDQGRKVRLRFQAYPYQKFGQFQGTVSEVSRSQIEPGNLPATLPFQSAQPSEGLYRISVKLESQLVSAYGKSIPLVAGMIVDADIEQDTRRLIEWVLEPLYAIGGKIL